MLLICVFHLKKRLAVIDGELRHHRARPEHIAVHCDVVAENLGENPLGLQPPIQHLMTRPYPPLQLPTFCRIHVVPGAFDFFGVAAVALVSLDPLARLEEVPQNLVENFNVSILTSRVCPLNPNRFPAKMSTPSSYCRADFPAYLWDANAFPFFCDSLLQDSEVGSINGHRAVIAHIVGTKPTLEDNLRSKEAAAAGG